MTSSHIPFTYSICFLRKIHTSVKYIIILEHKVSIDVGQKLKVRCSWSLAHWLAKRFWTELLISWSCLSPLISWGVIATNSELEDQFVKKKLSSFLDKCFFINGNKIKLKFDVDIYIPEHSISFRFHKLFWQMKTHEKYKIIKRNMIPCTILYVCVVIQQTHLWNVLYLVSSESN